MSGRALRTARALLVVVALAVGASGCGGGSGDGPPTSGAPGGTAGSATLAVGSPTTTIRGLAPTTAPWRFEFVDYVVTGGIAGTTEGLKVFPDGRAVYSTGSRTAEFSIPAQAVADLRAALEAANLAALPPVNGTQTPDARTHRLIFGGQAVRFYDGFMPPELGRAVEILGRQMVRGQQQR